MRHGHRKLGRSAIVVLIMTVLAASLAACAGSGGGAGEQAVTLRLPFTMQGYDAPFFLALDRNYYKDAGLNVTIGEGKGSPVTAQTVANGADQFGFVDCSSAATLISKGASLVVVAALQQQGSPAIVYKPPVDIRTPHDLVGKTILGTGGNNDLLFQALLQKAGIPKSDVHNITVVQAATAKQTFLNTPNAVYLSNINADAAALQVMDPSVKAVLYSDFGINVLGYCLITRPDLVKNQSEMVSNFVSASVKGWQASVDDPQAAVDATLKHHPELAQNLTLAQLNATLKLLHTSATGDKPIGWMAQSDWQQTIDVLTKYLPGFKADKAVTDFYTNEFVAP